MTYILCLVCFAIVSYNSGLNTALGLDSQSNGSDLDSLEYPFLSLASIELRTPGGQPLELQNAIVTGQEVVISSAVSTVSGSLPDQNMIMTYLVQAKDEEDVVQFVKESEFAISVLSQLDITWTPEQSGIYSIEVFVWSRMGDDSNKVFIPLMEDWRIINIFASPSKVFDAAETQLPSGISLEIEKLGTRQFYQDRDMFLPTQLSVSRNETVDWMMIAWPSIGPNYVISKLESSEHERVVVFDYYESLGIDANMTSVQYDEFMKSKDLEPFPTTAGRYFGFGWNQTDLHGVKVGPGEYEAQLIMPVLIGDVSTGDDKRVRIVLTSAPEYFILLAGPPATLQHHLVLMQTVSQTELQTGGAYQYSLVLRNTGDQEEYFLLLGNSCPWEGSGGIVYPWYFNQPLMPGESYVITDGIAGAEKYPGIYPLNSSYVFAVPDESLEGKSDNDGVRASCIELEPNPIILHVTAPTYEGVKLVLESDKHVYKQNETVHLSLYIENSSDKPFVLTEDVPNILLRTSNGTEIMWGWVVDHVEAVTIKPHSIYRLDSFAPLDWDLMDVYQIPPYPEDGYTLAEPGDYSVEATFVFPYLEAETLTFTVIE